MSLFESIPREVNDMNHDGDPMWADEAIRATADEVVNLAGDGLLAVRYRGSYGIEFAVFEFMRGPAIQVDTGEVVGGTKYDIVFHGEGAGDRNGGGLRELRHTYWGDEGYIFYPSAALISDAFRVLARWFDVD